MSSGHFRSMKLSVFLSLLSQRMAMERQELVITQLEDMIPTTFVGLALSTPRRLLPR